MPQFNPDDAAIYNHGIPKRLLEVFDSPLPAFIRDEFPDAICQKLYGHELFRECSGVIHPEQLFACSEFGPILAAAHKFQQGITAATGIEFTGLPCLKYYRDEQAHTPWNLGVNELYAGSGEVIMVSFGAVRILNIRFIRDHDEIFSLALKDGMAAHLKQPLSGEWELRIPVIKGPATPTLLVLLFPESSSIIKNDT